MPTVLRGRNPKQGLVERDHNEGIRITDLGRSDDDIESAGG